MSDSSDKSNMIEHLRELRNRVVICVVMLIIAFILSYVFAVEIYQFLVRPLAELTNGQGRRMIYTGLAEGFFTNVKLSIFAAFIISFPVLSAQIYLFISPALYKKEKRFVMPFIVIAPFLFLLGAAMVYYFIIPLAWEFFLSFEILNTGDGAAMPIELEARISEYLSLVTSLIIAFGLAFQLPVILTLLAKIGVIDDNWLRKKRKFAVIIVFALAAIMTPPDVISQIGLAIPMLLLYELSIFLCKNGSTESS